MADRFGEGRDSLYRIGRAKDLLGRHIETGSRSRGAVTVRLDKPEWLANVQKSPRTFRRGSPGWVAKGEKSGQAWS